MKRTLRYGLAALITVSCLFTSCAKSMDAMDSGYYDKNTTAGSTSYSQSASPEMGFDYVGDTFTTNDSAPADAELQSKDVLANQKIIQNLYYNMETLEFDRSLTMIEDLCTELGGYIQSSSLEGAGINYSRLRSARYELRLPQGKLSELRSRVGEIGTVTSQESSSKNITEQYYDVEARLSSLRVQEERLLELMKQSGSLTDLIELERALADVTYEIEQLTGTLRNFDSLVDFSTVTIYLQEVTKYSDVVAPPKTLGERIAQTFGDSVEGLREFGEDLLVFFVGNSPVLLMLAVIAAVIIIVLVRLSRSARKKQKARKEALPKPEAEKENPASGEWKQ